MHLLDAIEEREGLEDTIQQLTIREKELNNKTQNALKASIKVIQNLAYPASLICFFLFEQSILILVFYTRMHKEFLCDHFLHLHLLVPEVFFSI